MKAVADLDNNTALGLDGIDRRQHVAALAVTAAEIDGKQVKFADVDKIPAPDRLDKFGAGLRALVLDAGFIDLARRPF